jgi:hypothetical protein
LDDVGVVQAGGGTSFAEEFVDRVAAGGEVRGKDFQGDIASQGELVGAVDLGQSAKADFTDYGIITDDIARSKKSWYLVDMVALAAGNRFPGLRINGNQGKTV